MRKITIHRNYEGQYFLKLEGFVQQDFNLLSMNGYENLEYRTKSNGDQIAEINLSHVSSLENTLESLRNVFIEEEVNIHSDDISYYMSLIDSGNLLLDTLLSFNNGEDVMRAICPDGFAQVVALKDQDEDYPNDFAQVVALDDQEEEKQDEFEDQTGPGPVEY